MMVAVTGASSSGKSAFAEQCLVNMGDKRRIYAATMIAWDEECRERIRKHRAMRSEKRFETVECPVDLEKLAFSKDSAVLLECMSNLAANELYRDDLPSEREQLSEREQSSEREQTSAEAKPSAGAGASEKKPQRHAAGARERIMRGLIKARAQASDLVVVTNEVFSDTGRYDAETKLYQELLGGLNQEIFKMADQVYEVVCGIPVSIKNESTAKRKSGRTEWKANTAERKSSRAEWKDNTAEWNGNRKVHMRLIVGGAYQGKEKFAWKLLGMERNPALAADGAKDSFEDAYKKRVVLNFHEYIRRIAEGGGEAARKRAQEFSRMLSEENRDVIVVADEIGCGIVPVDPADRFWRDLTGEAVQILAREAGEVYRVVGGLPQCLKGGSL